MTSRRLGCITFSGLIIGLLVVLLIGGVTLAKGGVLFSPGGLNSSVQGNALGGVKTHADIAGDCGACHPAPWSGQVMADRCLACHTDLAQDPNNFHKLMITQAELTSCFRCHTDHHGAQGMLTKTDLGKFPHNKLGYFLQGHQTMNGAPFACSDCHANNFTTFDQAICQTCHMKLDAKFMQPHLEAYGQDCLACHDGVDRYGKSFDHSKLAFTLSGKHNGLDCGKCHAGARTPADLRATPKDCYACHQKDDTHQGDLGTDCGKCHTPQDWKQAQFDHSQSKFTLVGQHIQTPCNACHINNVFKGTPTDCYSCHKDKDPHQGQFGQGCGGCHSPVDWKQVTFDHSQSAFPLVGQHAQVPCNQCHIDGVFKGTPTDCYSCHKDKDAHQGQFGQDCGACHSPNGWLPATFDHSKSGFPIDGAHARLQCSQCHVNNVFSGLSPDCHSCHAEPAYHMGLFGVACATCHTTTAWSPAQFNGSHPFPLRHGGAGDCHQCHPSTLSAWTCSTCHPASQVQSSHEGMAANRLTNCIQCHPTGSGGG